MYYPHTKMSSQQPKLIEKRIISGKGILKVPPDKKYRAFWVHTQLLRDPNVNFSSSKFNPDKSEYSKVCVLRDGRVIDEFAVTYELTTKFYGGEPTAYIASFLVCALAEIRTYLDYICIVNGKPPLPTDPTRRLYCEPILAFPDTLNFSCRDSSLLQISLWGIELDIDCTDSTPTPKLPPIEPKIPKISSGISAEVSSPYIPVDDNGDTQPSTIDTQAPFNPCLGVGWFRIQYTDEVTSDNITSYIRGKEDDIFAFGLTADVDCRDGFRQDLNMNGAIAYERWACQSRALNPLIEYLGVGFVPPISQISNNLLYPGC